MRGLYVEEIEHKGRGVFADKTFSGGEVIEAAPILIIPDKDWPSVASTMLSDYFFETEDDLAVLALGYASLYNHAFDPNAKYLTVADQIIITALRDIEKEEEITIDYGWDPLHFYEKGVVTKEQMDQLLEEEDEL